MNDPVRDPLGPVAGGLREVARIAGRADTVDDVLNATLHALCESLDFEGAAYLPVDGGIPVVAEATWSPTSPIGQDGTIAAGAGLALDAAGRSGRDRGEPVQLGAAARERIAQVFAEGRAHVLESARDEAVLEELSAALEHRLAAPCVLVPVRRAGDVEGLLLLTGSGPGTVDGRVIEIATVFGALLGLGIAAVARAARLEHLREVLQERNELLSEEVSADTDACRVLEASVSRPMRRLVEMARQVAATDAPVLVTGETGTGKEVLARAIHEWSGRSEGPFVQLNCAALSDHLIESELFGHVKGAFSGAVADRAGRFRVAEGGTLLLDEIGEMPLDAQTKLLRVLEVGSVVPVGADRAVDVDVRVIAATNVDLELAVDRGHFREDLYFRLHVFPLHLPPLRDRTADIPQLVDQLLTRMRRRTGHGPWRVREQDLKRLARYAWPGNVRELVNVLERARVFSPLGGTLELALDESREKRRLRQPRRRWPTMDDHQRAYLEDVLRHTGGKIYGPGGAAELLDVPPSTLQSRMRRFGVDRNPA